jgi:hypothetical protein
MSQVSTPAISHEPGLDTIEMVCERLGEMGLPIGPDTARQLVRSILEMEAPRVEAHVRDALETSLDTIRIATQSAMGVLAATERLPARNIPAGPPQPVLDQPPQFSRKTPAQDTRAVGARPPAPKRRLEEPAAESPPAPPAPRRDGDDFDGEEYRPVFRRPRR